MRTKMKSLLSVFLVMCIAVFGIGGMSGCDLDDGKNVQPTKSSVSDEPDSSKTEEKTSDEIIPVSDVAWAGPLERD